jgi:hypothetical protein
LVPYNNRVRRISVAGTTTKLMIFAEFERLPDPPDGFHSRC